MRGFQPLALAALLAVACADSALDEAPALNLTEVARRKAALAHLAAQPLPGAHAAHAPLLVDSVCRGDHLIIPGGLSNQVMLLVKLVEVCCRQTAHQAALVLAPRLASGIGHLKRDGLYLGAVLDMDAFRGAVWSVTGNCTVVEEPVLRAWRRAGAVDVSAAAMLKARVPKLSHTVSPLLRAVYGGLRLAPALNRTLAVCRAELAAAAGPSLAAVHMRVERDWYPTYCGRREAREQVRACFRPREIAQAVLATPELEGLGAVALLYATGNLAPEFRGAEEGPLRVWPHEVRAVAVADLACFAAARSYTESTALSFALATSAPSFVGTMKSTMTNMAVLHRQMHGLGRSFLYDCSAAGYARCVAAPPYRSFEETAAACHPRRAPGGGVSAMFGRLATRIRHALGLA